MNLLAVDAKPPGVGPCGWQLDGAQIDCEREIKRSTGRNACRASHLEVGLHEHILDGVSQTDGVLIFIQKFSS
jgi:hypothetical protein